MTRAAQARQARAAQPDPTAGRWPVDTGVAELLADADRFGGWLLTLDGTPQSYVDVLDPLHLEFDYVRRIGDLVEVLWPGRAPLTALHLGGGAATLPRWLAAARPGSRSLVVEVDAALVALVRAQLGLPRSPAVRVRVGDARAELAARPAASADLVVVDAYAGAAVPASLASVEAAGELARVLRPGGAVLANVADGAPLTFARAQVSTLRAALPEVVVVAAPGVLAGRRWGNVVLAASAGPLPVEAIRARVGGADLPTRVLAGAELTAWTGGAPPLTDAAGTGGRPIPRRR